MRINHTQTLLSLFLVGLLLGVACSGQAEVEPTAVADLPTSAPTSEPVATVVPTDPPPATPTPDPTVTPSPEPEAAAAEESDEAGEDAESPTAVPPTETVVAAAYGRTAEGALFRGNPNAPITIIDYSDFL